jgi:hypothetical protein
MQRSKLAAIELPVAAGAEAARAAIDHAFVAGYRWIMLVSAALAFASAAVAWVTIDNEVRAPDSATRRT